MRACVTFVVVHVARVGPNGSGSMKGVRSRVGYTGRLSCYLTPFSDHEALRLTQRRVVTIRLTPAPRTEGWKEHDSEKEVLCGMRIPNSLMRSAPVRLAACWFVLLCGLPGWAKEAKDDGAGVEMEDVTILPPFQVNGARMEDLGVRFGGQIGFPPSSNMLTVAEVFPNTAAAKAGLRPGERIVKIDGKTVRLATILSLGFKPEKLQQRMWAELRRGKKSVSITMEVRAPKAEETRTVTLTLPSPPPRWGSEQWQAPEGRTPAVVREPGPLAALAREVLDHGIWSGPYDRSGYEWRIVQPSGSHRIWVTQQNGKTEIRLEHRSVATGRSEFTTSPSGAMETGRCTPPKEQKRKDVPPEELRAQFEAEIDFWLHKVGRVTGRWPFEALSGETAVISSATISPMRSPVSPNATNSATDKVNPPLADSFLKLPVASAEQRQLLSDALGKIGLDENCWAFTETVRALDDGHTTTVRFDPSQPPEARCTLLKVDGKAPKAAYLKKWRDEGRETLPGLVDLPPLSSVVDLNDVRIIADETASVVFELPVKASNSDFPADKFQARFRVNKTHRGFEDFSVKLREPMRLAGIAKVAEAGLEARFQTFDPTLASQPVVLKMGGGVRLLFVKISHAFEITRTDFTKVIPFEEPGPPGL